MDFRGSVKIFLVKGGCQNLEIQGAPFVIRPSQKFRGVETLVRAMHCVYCIQYGLSNDDVTVWHYGGITVVLGGTQ